jgi:hypothetical protein
MTSPFPSLGVGGGARRPIIAGSRGPTGCSGDKLSRRGRSYLRPAASSEHAIRRPAAGFVPSQGFQ